MLDKKLVFSAIKEYNKYHSPEATVELKDVGKNFLTVTFSGPFCNTCGVTEWFEDFRIELEKRNLKTYIGEIKEIDGQTFLVKFIIR
ncbi:MAG: hypothetical protein N3F64_07380 [Nitrososphaeria archaeon]|nr:hypothetical protein [Nitrososphaeria archaeon]